MKPNCSGITRRGFLLRTGAGLAAGGSLAILGQYGWQTLARHQPKIPSFSASDGMPGPFPGRVVEVHHPGSVKNDYAIDAGAVKAMVERGMRDLAGADDATGTWRRLFQRGDRVGIKVNPVGGRRASSRHELVVEVVRGLKSAGVEPEDIIVFERYADAFREQGYEDLLRGDGMEGVRWYAAAAAYDRLQVDIEGYDAGQERDKHVVGYDPDVFVHMGWSSYRLHPKDDRGYRSHMSIVVSRMIDKFINLPVLKDHGSAGVTLALKNISHGMFNNVARSHLDRVPRGSDASGPNQCNTFIPTAAAHPLIRRKATLHIMDGLVGVYQGGPGADKCWACKSLFFATDPVALDHIGWDRIDEKRKEAGLQPVGKVGIATAHPGTEAYDRRQPEHIILAGTAGLGWFERQRISHQRVEINGPGTV
jgi:uncharacterized protein (DUF362 family)